MHDYKASKLLSCRVNRIRNYRKDIPVDISPRNDKIERH